MNTSITQYLTFVMHRVEAHSSLSMVNYNIVYCEGSLLR